MIIGLLISALSVTYTIASSNSLTVSGEAPERSEAVYSRTGSGQKDRITAGHSTTLQLTGWDGVIVKEVVLSMRSNTSQGAGSLQMHIGDEMVWEIADSDFASVAWNGEFTMEWQDVSCRSEEGWSVGAGEDITIYVEASVNSLYIASYTIYYELPEPVPHVVCLEQGLGEKMLCLEEDNIASGVLLPLGVDTLGWRFLGWSEEEVKDMDDCPSLWMAGERYYPQCDCTLWAVYSDSEGMYSVVDGVSGYYVLGNSFWGRCMMGDVDEGCVATKQVAMRADEENTMCEWLDDVEEELVYYVDFLSDSTLQLEHVKTGCAIGYSGTTLTKTKSVWQYRILDDGSLGLYYYDAPQYRMLYMGYTGDSEDVVAFAMRVEIDKMHSHGILLFPVRERHFTSCPLGDLDSVENVWEDAIKSSNEGYSMHFGPYLLQIQNGEKRLMLNK